MAVTAHWQHWGAHPELKKAIEDKFKDEHDRVVAWTTIGIVREVFPQTDDMFKGEFLGEGGE